MDLRYILRSFFSSAKDLQTRVTLVAREAVKVGSGKGDASVLTSVRMQWYAAEVERIGASVCSRIRGLTRSLARARCSHA